MTTDCLLPGAAGRARDYVLGRLAGAAARDFEDHLAGCPACADRVTRMDDGLGKLEADLEAPARAVGAPARPWAGWAAAAAAAAVVGVVMIVGRGPGEPGPPAARPEEPGGRLRSPAARVEALEPRGEVAAAPSFLRWRSEEPGSCRASIVREDLTEVWSAPPAGGDSAAIPEEVRARLRPGTAYLWRVVCGFGPEEAGSPYTGFRIAPAR
jgi:hypothetical protein